MFEIIGIEDKSYVRQSDNQTVFRKLIYYTYPDGNVQGKACASVMVNDEAMAKFTSRPEVGLKCFLTIRSEQKGRGSDSYMVSQLVDCFALPASK